MGLQEKQTSEFFSHASCERHMEGVEGRMKEGKKCKTRRSNSQGAESQNRGLAQVSNKMGFLYIFEIVRVSGIWKYES